MCDGEIATTTWRRIVANVCQMKRRSRLRGCDRRLGLLSVDLELSVSRNLPPPPPPLLFFPSLVSLVVGQKISTTLRSKFSDFSTWEYREPDTNASTRGTDGSVGTKSASSNF